MSLKKIYLEKQSRLNVEGIWFQHSFFELIEIEKRLSIFSNTSIKNESTNVQEVKSKISNNYEIILNIRIISIDQY
jgi:hypothetical protein